MPISTIGSNSLNQTSDLTINGQTVGKGGGNVATNTAHGVSALQANTSGGGNTALGYQAGYSNQTQSNTTAIGYQAGYTNTGDNELVAVGYKALFAATTGTNNTALGHNTLAANTTGSHNLAVGSAALTANTTGSYNTALGRVALVANTTASNNTAVGYQALYSNTTGAQNTAIGREAGKNITTANYNCYVGDGAGTSTTGARNTFIGQGAGNAVTSGANNTIIGGYNGNNGGLDIRTASNYVVLADGNGNPRIYVNSAGSMYAPGVYNTTAGVSSNLYVDSSGLFYRATSSLKYKTDVENATHGLADVLKLRPITYRGKAEVDVGKTYGGLLAEEVHDAGLTEFVQYADDGSPDALHYGNMVSLAFKAIQELKTIVDAQAAEIAELKAKVA